MNIGVIALQGAYTEHMHMLEKCGCEVSEIKRPDELTDILDGIILPGSDCRALSAVLSELGMLTKLKMIIKEGLPVMGTCAGLSLLAKNIADCDTERIGSMDITAVCGSYRKNPGIVHKACMFDKTGIIPMTFIRAPFISQVHGSARVLAVSDGRIVAARDGSQLAVSFHPQLDDSTLIYSYFIDMIKSQVRKDNDSG
ncbi:MAG: pyridoxal 5'-phosphate synthase glutaminase subunit PdxT [Oscillospiraceae bacterium]|nr:pyridoxal 5'-phosphate synthase glutaminase subunit PdxT [Oscillospiraceae bacterium]